jgi:dipeptidyl-peptidase-4
MGTTRRRFVLLALALLAAPAAAQQAGPVQDPSTLTLDRIFASADFRGQFFGGARWLETGTAYTTVERSQQPRGMLIVRVDAASGARDTLVTPAQLTPPGDTAALAIENYVLTPDLSKVLVFTNSQPVWRNNSRGDFWVLDRGTGRLRKLGGPAARPSTLMFAKFSPDGTRVGYVREFNLYVEDLATGRVTALTSGGSRTLINGTFDWVYEEELMDYWADGWRWSPDGRSIAYWQLDASGVRDYALLNTTDSLYSRPWEVQYPKAGERNSAARIGVVAVAGGPTRWMRVPGDPRENYIARLEFVPPGHGALSGQLILQHLNRLQTVLTVYTADPRTGGVRPLFVEQYPRGWVDLFDGCRVLRDGRILWLGESSGWNHVAAVADGGERRPITSGDWDVFGFLGVDEDGGWVYYTASPENLTQRYLYRARLDGTGRPERLTPADQPGAHGYDVAPGARFAIHTHSRLGVPPVTELVSLPDHRVVRTLVDNAPLRQRVAALRRGPAEFFAVDASTGVRLTGWVIKPPDFDPTRRYPAFLSIYGGPLPNSIQNIQDAWGGTGYLWNLMLAQQGYLVVAIENRGVGPHGRDWRRATYGQLGVLESEDFTNGMRAMWRQFPWVDSTRVGIYGHSYGGFMALNAILRYPDVFATAISAAPVTNWRYYDTIYTERYMGLPSDNAAGYERGSPITYAANLRGNLLLVHGTGDDNVHVQNSEAMINALVRHQRQFTLMLYPNRNHGIGSDGAARHRFELYTRFLAERMPGGPAR